MVCSHNLLRPYYELLFCILFGGLILLAEIQTLHAELTYMDPHPLFEKVFWLCEATSTYQNAAGKVV